MTLNNMNLEIERWEMGSDFHMVTGYTGIPSAPWLESGRLTVSGRAALLFLLEHLELQRSYSKVGNSVWLPAYSCDQLEIALLEAGHRVRFWDGSPIAGWEFPDPEMRPNDIVVLHNYFGLEVACREHVPALQGRGVLIIEDHSHAPSGILASSSKADYAFASLRKTLPLSDGGVMWSPSGETLPEPETDAPIVTPRIAAMLGKAAYLRGEPFPKPQYREWYVQAEALVGAVRPAGMSDFARQQLASFDTQAWDSARARNISWLHVNIPTTIEYSIISVPDAHETMGLLLYFHGREARDRLRSYLNSRQVYGAVLWPLPHGVSRETAPQATDFQERMLFLHADGRYVESDLARMCDLLDEYQNRV
ncbi:hypothetical protein [Deinococcus yunweiensis]|uniref:hypothetical protein n=1 Tax=Deinococcus yunweiensis TaxID=367282 RepID=UPI00398E841A